MSQSAKSSTGTLPQRMVLALREALADTELLLGFLIEANDGRLQSQFTDTRPQMSAPFALIAVPPCDTYEEFLTRLTELGQTLNNDTAPELPPTPASAGGKTPLGHIPFITWSRDFLASVAAPASVDSIAISRFYVRQRAEARTQGTLDAIRRFFSPSRPDEQGDADDAPNMVQRQRVASWMATMLHRREALALWLTVALIALSTYAISGHIILQARQNVIDEGKDIARRIESAEQDLTLARASAAPRDAAPGPVIPLCDQITHDPADPNKYSRRYVAVPQINLCMERQRNINQGIAVAAQMLSWLRVIDWSGLPWLFGDNAQVANALGRNPYLCYLVTHQPPSGEEADKGKAGGAACDDFEKILLYYGHIPDAVQQCLTLYILPCLYGALGAILATIRYVRGRVSASMLNYIDRGRISQDWVLGLVLGAVIGLFSDYIAKANPVQGITLAAIALLAGYNVSAVFGLFENVSNRLFATADAGKRGDPGKPTG